MPLHASHRYSASARTLFGLVTNQDFLQQKYLAVGSRQLEFRSSPASAGVHPIRWRRQLPADIPALARSLFDVWNQFDEQLEWRNSGDTAEGIYSAKIKGGLVELKGLFHIRPDPQGCVETVDMQVKVNVPLLREKLAAVAMKGIQQHLDDEYAFTKKWIEQHRLA